MDNTNAIDSFRQRVTDEYNAYKREMCSLPPEELFGEAYYISLHHCLMEFLVHSSFIEHGLTCEDSDWLIAQDKVLHAMVSYYLRKSELVGLDAWETCEELVCEFINYYKEDGEYGQEQS